MQRLQRDLTEGDIEFFEKQDGFLSYVTFFIKALTKGKERAITAADFDYYLNFTTAESNEEFEEEKSRDDERLSRIETSHTILNWLFDLLQFCFQYLVKSDQPGSDSEDRT